MLKKYRNEIDSIDKEMKELFIKRMQIAKNVADYKKKNKVAIHDINREKEMFEKLMSDIKDPKLKELYAAFLLRTVELSKLYQKDVIEND